MIKTLENYKTLPKLKISPKIQPRTECAPFSFFKTYWILQTKEWPPAAPVGDVVRMMLALEGC